MYPKPRYAILLTFFTGIVILIAGFLRLGFLIDFFSLPVFTNISVDIMILTNLIIIIQFQVIAGFTSAAAITIASSQVDNA